MTMTPLYFGDRFGWLHQGDATAASGLGVVFCPAFAQEEVCTHHGWLALADDLVAAGHAVLRFDYRGTGNAADAVPSIESMVADTLAAAETLATLAGVDRIALVGLRLGGAVALLAAERVKGLAGLALLAPVLSGSAFLRETRASAAVASLSTLEPVPPPDSDQPLNTNGFKWSAAFQRDVATIDLMAHAAPAVPALLMSARGDRRVGKLAAAWCAAGGTVSDASFADYEGWMQDPTIHRNPVEDFARIAAWINSLPPRPHAPAASQEADIARSLNGDGFVETPLRFGADGAVFGILCRPTGRQASPIGALLVHEGSTHSIGNGRAYVALARRLAREGHVSLRFDLTGTGDSPAHGNDRHPHYDPERIAECVAAMDILDEAGCPKAVALGLCSGAYTAQEVTLADDRIVGNVILNLQKFVWNYGDDIRVAVRDNKRSFKAYVRAMRNPGEWRRAIAGEADLPGIARVLAKRTWQRMRHAIISLLPPAEGSERAKVRAKLHALSERGVFATLVLSDEDPGLAEMAMHLGRGGKRLAAYPPVRLIVLDKADHHFNGSLARARHGEIVLEVLARAVAAHQTTLPQPSVRERKRLLRAEHVPA